MIVGRPRHRHHMFLNAQAASLRNGCTLLTESQSQVSVGDLGVIRDVCRAYLGRPDEMQSLRQNSARIDARGRPESNALRYAAAPLLADRSHETASAHTEALRITRDFCVVSRAQSCSAGQIGNVRPRQVIDSNGPNKSAVKLRTRWSGVRISPGAPNSLNY